MRRFPTDITGTEARFAVTIPLYTNFDRQLVDMQHLLPHGTPEQVRAEVRRYCETLDRDGGYILGPAHLFQPDVPPDNILAVYQH